MALSDRICPRPERTSSRSLPVQTAAIFSGAAATLSTSRAVFGFSWVFLMVCVVSGLASRFNLAGSATPPVAREDDRGASLCQMS
jgi:hypothetical protein